ncbi:MAG: alpha/beta fold hydrolase [Phycisphaerae bacterium]|nr:alpha/beta fold hydrolase [Phycisphaerae bacterium]
MSVRLDIAFDDLGSGMPLILMHGFPLDRRIWSETARLLSDSFRLIALDLPGFGESKSSGTFTMDSMARDVHEFLAKMDVNRYILGGLSMGGYVAHAYANQFRAELAGLLLTNTKSAADTDEAKRGREQMAEIARTRGAVPVAEQMFPKMLTKHTIESEPQVADRVRTIMNGCPPRTIEHACIAMRDRADYTAQLSRYEIPTLIITGSEDPIATPDIAAQMHAGLRRGQLAIIPDASHLTPLEQPQLFADAVRSFFSAID